MPAGEDAEASKKTEELLSPVSEIIAEVHGTGTGSINNELIQLKPLTHDYIGILSRRMRKGNHTLVLG
jgi:hypothetical protein